MGARALHHLNQINMKRYATTGIALLCLWATSGAAAASDAPSPDKEAIQTPAAIEPSVVVPPKAPEAQPSDPFRYSGVVPITLNTWAAAGQKNPDLALRVVSVSARKADVALLVAGALLGSFRNMVSKEDYRGDKFEAFVHPAMNSLVPGIQKMVDEWVAVNAAGRSFKNKLTIQPYRFQLVYRGTDSDPDPYDLQISAHIERKPDSAGYFSQPQQYWCSVGNAQSPWGLADWQANDGQRIREYMQQFVAQCLADTKEQLPKLLAP